MNSGVSRDLSGSPLQSRVAAPRRAVGRRGVGCLAAVSAPRGLAACRGHGCRHRSYPRLRIDQRRTSTSTPPHGADRAGRGNVRGPLSAARAQLDAAGPAYYDADHLAREPGAAEAALDQATLRRRAASASRPPPQPATASTMAALREEPMRRGLPLRRATACVRLRSTTSTGTSTVQRELRPARGCRASRCDSRSSASRRRAAGIARENEGAAATRSLAGAAHTRQRAELRRAPPHETTTATTTPLLELVTRQIAHQREIVPCAATRRRRASPAATMAQHTTPPCEVRV